MKEIQKEREKERKLEERKFCFRPVIEKGNENLVQSSRKIIKTSCFLSLSSPSRSFLSFFQFFFLLWKKIIRQEVRGSFHPLAQLKSLLPTTLILQSTADISPYIHPVEPIQRPPHYGTKPGHSDTSKIHFPTSEGVSEVSERANEWA